MKKIIVIGGGASGLMAAIQAARCGASVTILEKQKKSGSKILRTGNGRCNFTNTGDPDGRYHGRHPEFAEELLSQWASEDTISFFEELGVLPYRNGSWIYPHTEQAQTIQRALLDECRNRNVKIKNQEQVNFIRKSGRNFLVETPTWKYEADAVIICCGTEASQKKEYQTGAFHLFPKICYEENHPALCPLFTDRSQSARWAGTRVRAVASLISNGDILHRESGQIQFTRDGISGIPIMNMSSKAWKSLKEKSKTEVVLDLVPEMTGEELSHFLTQHDGNTNGIVPEKLSRMISEESHRPSEKAAILKHFAIGIRSAGGEEQSQVLGGGFLTDQFDPKTMMMKSERGIFAAGEVLDIDGECGGWNLQFAWATGAVAGKAAALL